MSHDRRRPASFAGGAGVVGPVTAWHPSVARDGVPALLLLAVAWAADSNGELSDLLPSDGIYDSYDVTDNQGAVDTAVTEGGRSTNETDHGVEKAEKTSKAQASRAWQRRADHQQPDRDRRDCGRCGRQRNSATAGRGRNAVRARRQRGRRWH